MTLDGIYPCEECGRVYNHKVLDGCPRCRVVESREEAGQQAVRPVRSGHLVASVDNLVFQDLLKRQIEATNRTTHAVRAFVSYVAIIVISYSLAGFIYGFGIGFASSTLNLNFAVFTTWVAVLVAVVGNVIALWQFLSEWRQSRVPSGRI